MSFRLFIYHCTVCGGLAAYLGWAAGRPVTARDDVLQAGLQGLLVGLLLGVGLGLVDALWNNAPGRAFAVAFRTLVAAAGGCAAGFVGGYVGQALYGRTQYSAFLVAGWTATGLLVGASVGLCDLLTRLLTGHDSRGARRKLLHGGLGGAAGGLLGGVLFLVLRTKFSGLFEGRSPSDLWTPGAAGFTALGACVGLMIGLAQVLLKEAWLRVEAGFRPGRELILTKDDVTIGRAETCDVGLFGDPGVERAHARILRRDGRFVLVDEATQSGTYLNGARIDDPTELRSGDRIRVGRSTLRFGERSLSRRPPGGARLS